MMLNALHNKIASMAASDRPDRVNDAFWPPGTAEKPHSQAAERALQEAASRRAATDAREVAREPEHQGRGGLDPVRYEDWEVRGLASDF